MIEIREYIAINGKTPFANWFDGLDSQAASKVTTYLLRIEQGNFSQLKPIKGSFGEVRIDWGPGYRIYVGKDGPRLIVLFGGGVKKGQSKDIRRALTLWNEYKLRKKRE